MRAESGRNAFYSDCRRRRSADAHQTTSTGERPCPSDEALRSSPHADAARAGLNELLALLDTRLARQPWMLGDTYSLVDLLVGSVIGYSNYIGAPVAAHAHVQQWLGRVQARPAMQIEGV